MSKFFFFTDIDSVGNQAATDAFGPVIGAPETQYRVTSIHRPTQTATPNAYAVCDGLLLVQDAGNSLVNLILKPTEQPPFAFPKIIFFIYRGIQKDSLVSGSDVAPAAKNDLTKSIWDSQQAKNGSAGTSDNAPIEALGLDISGDGSIDDVFYRENVSYQLPLVRSGWSLGKFDSMQFGFEIMVEAIGFDPELPLVRTADNIVNVTALPDSPTQAQEFEYWHDKEAILNYIDPCAFFGGFYLHMLKVKSNGSVSKKKKNEIYDDVLKGLHLTAAGEGVFFNRNRTYLDIRNEYNHSINYFKNYGTYSNTDIDCAFDSGGALSAKNYYDNTWPLMIIDNGDLPTNNALTRNIIRLALPDGAGDNPFPTLYISAGYLNDSYPREPKEKARLIDLNVSSGFTDEVSMAIPNRDGLASTTAVSSYIKLKYFKRFDPAATMPPVSSGTVIRASNYLDNLFSPFAMRIPFGGTGGIKLIVYNEQAFVDATSVLESDFISNIGVADDGLRYTFFTLSEIVRKEGNLRIPFTVSGGHYKAHTNLFSFIESKAKTLSSVKSNLVLTPPNIDYVDIEQTASGTAYYNEPSVDELIIIGLSKSSLDGVDISAFENKYRIHLAFIDEQRVTDNIGQPYTSYEIALRGFTSNSGIVQFEQINTNIMVYAHGKSI